MDNGAELSVGHGTLVTKGIEVYNGKVIFYSLGKFLMKGRRPTGDVPIGVNAAVGKDTRKGLAAMVDIEDGKIASAAFTPTFAEEESRPAFLKAEDPLFGEYAGRIDTMQKAEGLSASKEEPRGGEKSSE